MDTLRTTSECNAPIPISPSLTAKGQTAFIPGLLPSLPVLSSPPALPLCSHSLDFCVGEGAVSVMSPQSHYSGSVWVSFCPCRQWGPVQNLTPQSCSSSFVGHTAGLHRHMGKKRLDHCLFSLIFIVPLLFLPLITSNRKVPLCLPHPLQLLV